MIKHVAMWKIKDMAEGRTKGKNSDILRMNIDALKFVIPQIVTIDSGPCLPSNESNYDFGLVATFKTEEDMAKYKEHPEFKIIENLLAQIVLEGTKLVFNFKTKK